MLFYHFFSRPEHLLYLYLLYLYLIVSISFAFLNRRDASLYRDLNYFGNFKIH